MNARGLLIKPAGIMLVALLVPGIIALSVLTLSCTPKKSAEQSADTAALEARIAELEAALSAELETTQADLQTVAAEPAAPQVQTPPEAPQDLQSIINSLKTTGAGEPIPAVLANTVSWFAEGDEDGLKINPDGSGTIYGRISCTWIVKGDLLALSIPDYTYSAGGGDPYTIDYFNHALWEVKDGLLYLTPNEYTNTYIDDLFFVTISRSPLMPGGK